MKVIIIVFSLLLSDNLPTVRILNGGAQFHPLAPSYRMPLWLSDESDDVHIDAHHQEQDKMTLSNRMGFSQLAGKISLVTVTKYTTSFLFFTCTVSTTACAGRRRRAVLSDLIDDLRQFEVSPSPVNKIEPTDVAASPSEEATGSRWKRDASPQLFGAYPGIHLRNAEVESSSTIEERDSLLSSTGHLPALHTIFFRRLPGYLPQRRQFGLGRTTYITFTSTGCIVSAITSTSIPTCSVRSGFAQCAKPSG